MTGGDALLAVLVGLASGVLSGMFGVGGAVLTTPGIRVLGATPIEAVGSTLPAILPASIAGSLRYRAAGLIERRIALISAGAGTVFAVLGAALSDVVNARYLMLATAGLLLWTAIRNLRAVGGPVDRLPEPAEALDDPPAASRQHPVRIGVIGAGAGLLAGLLGVGGGILLVPAYVTLLRLPPKRAVATSLVAVGIFSIPAMVTHAVLGHIHWGFAVALVAGVVPGAQLGARFTISGSDARLRVLMALFFGTLAVIFGVAEAAAL